MAGAPKSPTREAAEADRKRRAEYAARRGLFSGPTPGTDESWHMPLPPNRRASLGSPPVASVGAHAPHRSRSAGDLHAALLAAERPFDNALPPPDEEASSAEEGARLLPTPTTGLHRRTFSERTTADSANAAPREADTPQNRNRPATAPQIKRRWLYALIALLLLLLIVLLSVLIPGATHRNQFGISANRKGGRFGIPGGNNDSMSLYNGFAIDNLEDGNLSSYLSYACADGSELSTAPVSTACQLQGLSDEPIPLLESGQIVTHHNSQNVIQVMNQIIQSCVGNITRICSWWHYLVQGVESNILTFTTAYDTSRPTPSGTATTSASIIPSGSPSSNVTASPSHNVTASATPTPGPACAGVVCVASPPSTVDTQATVPFNPFQLLGFSCTRNGVPTNLSQFFAIFGFRYAANENNYIPVGMGCGSFGVQSSGDPVVCATGGPVSAANALPLYKGFVGMLGPDIDAGDSRTMSCSVQCGDATQWIDGCAVSTRER